MTTLREAFADMPDMVGAEFTSKIGNNTCTWTAGPVTSYRLHRTDVLQRLNHDVHYLPAGAEQLWTGGWETVTTKARINEFATACHVFAVKGVWYVGGYDHDVLFEDGMILLPRPDMFGNCVLMKDRHGHWLDFRTLADHYDSRGEFVF